MRMIFYRFGVGLVLGAAIGLTGCAAAKPINCDVVRLQREAGRSPTEIAESFSASQSEIEKCGGASGAAASAPSAPAPPAEPAPPPSAGGAPY